MSISREVAVRGGCQLGPESQVSCISCTPGLAGLQGRSWRKGQAAWYFSL